MTRVVTFTVPGPCVPWQRAGRGGGRSYTQPESALYRSSVGWNWLKEAPKGWPVDGMYSLRVVARYMDRRRRDGDNLLKQVGDALQGLAYKDDSQVVRAEVFKLSGAAESKTEIEVAIVDALTLGILVSKSQHWSMGVM